MATHTIEAAPTRGNAAVRDRTFRDAAESYIRAGGEAKYLDRIIAALGDRPLGDIHPYDVREMAETIYPTQSAATRNRQALTPARAVMLHAYERGWCPPIRIRAFRQDRPRQRRPASPLWLHLFCRQADRDGLAHLSALVLTMATTGARISEATALRWSEVDLATRSILLLKTKTSRNSVRSLTDEVVERLRLMRDGRPAEERVFRYASRYGVNERIRAVCERAGIPNKPPHTCGRHTFATTSMELGIDIATAMKAGDWRSSRVFLETYVHPRINAGRLVADRLNGAVAAEL